MWITWAVPLSDGSELAPGAGAALVSSTSHLPGGFRYSSSPPPLWLEHSRDDRTRRDLLGHEDAPPKANPPCNPQENTGVPPARKEHVSRPKSRREKMAANTVTRRVSGFFHVLSSTAAKGWEPYKAPHNVRSILSPNSTRNSEITTCSCDNQQTAGSVKSNWHFGGIRLGLSPYTHTLFFPTNMQSQVKRFPLHSSGSMHKYNVPSPNRFVISKLGISSGPPSITFSIRETQRARWEKIQCRNVSHQAWEKRKMRWGAAVGHTTQ